MARYNHINNSGIDPKEWSVCATGKRYRGKVDPANGLPDGLGILEVGKDLYYVGELKQGKRHGRGFMLRLEDRSRDEKYWYRYSYEQVMSTAEFDSCGRVVSTGPSGEWRTSHVEEYTFVKEQDGVWTDDSLVCEIDCNMLKGQRWSGYTLMQRDLLLTSGDYPVDWNPWHTELTKLEGNGILKINGYPHFITPYNDYSLMVLNYSGSAPFVVAKGGMTYWDTVDSHDNHTQHFYALYPSDAENVFEIEDGVLKHCTVRQPHVAIPWEVTQVAPECFCGPDGEGQDTLCSVSISKNCQKIGREAFARCKNLQHVLVLGQTAIDDRAFVSCQRLRHIELWRGVSRLGNYSLAYCESLPYVFIPKSLNSMGKDVAAQHDPETGRPVFYCQRTDAAKGWDENWNRAYHDDNDRQADTRHEVVFGASPTQGSQHFLPQDLLR